MIGDKIELKDHQLPAAQSLVDRLQSHIDACDRYVISIGGESGCGKSTMAFGVNMLLEQEGISCVILHMDDYFKLPPKTNHEAREKDISKVGKQEVHLDLLQSHIDAFKFGKQSITKPLVYYAENKIQKEKIDLAEVKVLIVEGTFVTSLININSKVFLDRNYHLSYENRLKRGRDVISPFVENVLEIEHQIISRHKEFADYIFDQNYLIRKNDYKLKWWKREVMYQIYPRSFQDSNDDGIGDIRGIIKRLDYLQELGVGIIWLSPVYQSPNHDNGYDISDYRAIHPEFGTMKDFEELLTGCHQRGMRLIMDLVVNHTSYEHAWFQKSQKSKDNPYRDYYIWKEGKNGGPPNNWKAWFGGDAWSKDETSGEYYLHLFTKYQPDLNWENPKVREEIHDVVKYWLEKGVDGFRMDVISLISKQQDFLDSTSTELMHLANNHYANGPRIHEFLQDLNRKVLQHYDIMTVGEGPGIDKQTVTDYIGHDRNELNMIFQLELMFLDNGPGGKFDYKEVSLQSFKKNFADWDKAMGVTEWNNIFLDNHDFPRMVSRYGDDHAHRKNSAKMLILFLMTMRGTPCFLQGSEIGMTNVSFDDLDDYRDIESLTYIQNSQKEGVPESEIRENLLQQSRDNVRTPVHWSSESNAGFTNGTPWIPVNKNFTAINIERDIASDDSIISFFKQVRNIRNAYEALISGFFEDLLPEHGKIYAYRRYSQNSSFLIVLNFSSNEIDIQEFFPQLGELVIGNKMDHEKGKLSAWEGVVYKEK